jgi:putative transposase
MPWGLKRFQKTGDLRYITFTCYHRRSLLGAAAARGTFEQTLERVRNWHGLAIVGYVVMPEHVYLLISEQGRSRLAIALQMLKQVTARKLSRIAAGGPPFRPVLAKGGAGILLHPQRQRE